MGILSKLRSIFTSSSGIATANLGSSQQLTSADLVSVLTNPGGSIASLLIDASAEGSLQYSPVFAAERFISESIAALPFLTYVRDGSSKDRAVDHPAYALLRSRPNGYQSSFTFWKTAISTAIRKGNAFIFIARNNGGQPVSLSLVDNNSIRIAFTSGVKSYLFSAPDLQGTIADEDMIHLIGYSLDGINGIPLLSYAADTIKLGRAVEKYAIRYFISGQHSKGHLEIPAGVTQQQYQQLVESYRAAYEGDENSWKTPVLAYGAKFVSDSIPNSDAQLLELRKFQLLEVARLFRVPPQILQHYENGGTYANIEAQAIDLVQNSLQPWITQIEQEVNRKLFTDDSYFAEFLIDARLRGDTLTRYQAYQIGRQGGWLSTNDIRRSENLPEIEGGDDYLNTPVGASPNPDAPQTGGAAAPEPQPDQTSADPSQQEPQQ